MHYFCFTYTDSIVYNSHQDDSSLNNLFNRKIFQFLSTSKTLQEFRWILFTKLCKFLPNYVLKITAIGIHWSLFNSWFLYLWSWSTQVTCWKIALTTCRYLTGDEQKGSTVIYAHEVHITTNEIETDRPVSAGSNRVCILKN